MQRSLSNYLLGHFIWFDLLIGFLWPLPMPNLLVSVSARISENSLDTRFLYISNSIFYFNFAITRISSMKNALKLFRQPTLSFWLLNCSRVLMIFFLTFSWFLSLGRLVFKWFYFSIWAWILSVIYVIFINEERSLLRCKL